MDLEQRVNAPDYKNWIKGTLALIHICEAVRDYTKYVFEQFKQNLRDGSHFDGGFNASWMCRNTDFRTNGWVFTATCGPCTNLFNQVLNCHLKKDKSVGFENCKNKQVAGSWGIAKIFMPKYCHDIEKPEDTDAHALFHMILNCSLFRVTHSHVETIIKARNEMMHSKTNTISYYNTTKNINAMKYFLKEASTTLTGPNHSSVQCVLEKAIREIDDLLQSSMNIDLLSKSAKEALTYKKECITQSVARITSSGGDNAQELKEYLEILEKLGGELQFWNRHPWEVGKLNEINKIRGELDAANKEKEKLKEDLSKVKADLQNTNTEMSKLQNELTEFHDKLNVMTKENEIFKKDLSKVHEELETTKRQKEKFQDDLNIVREHMTEANKEHDSIKAELKLVSEGMNNTKEENKSLQEDVNDIRKRMDIINNENEQAKNEIAEVNEDLSIAEGDRKLVEQDIKDVHKTVEGLELSTSDDKNHTEVGNTTKIQDDQINALDNEEIPLATEQELQMVRKLNDDCPEKHADLQQQDNFEGVSTQLQTPDSEEKTTDGEMSNAGEGNTGEEQVIEEQNNSANKG